MDVVYVDPVKKKTGWRIPTEVQRKEEPKQMCQRLQSMCKTYLKKDYSALKRNFGSQSRNEPLNMPPGVFLLFPSYWPPSRNSAFSTSNMSSVLGVTARQARSLLIKEFTPQRLQQHNIEPIAVSQSFHHSQEVQEGSYKYGLKNTINRLQCEIFGKNKLFALTALVVQWLDLLSTRAPGHQRRPERPSHELLAPQYWAATLTTSVFSPSKVGRLIVARVSSARLSRRS